MLSAHDCRTQRQTKQKQWFMAHIVYMLFTHIVVSMYVPVVPPAVHPPAVRPLAPHALDGP